MFSNIPFFQTHCCNPFQKHKKLIKKQLKCIPLEMAKLYKRYNLIPGKKLCNNCWYEILSQPSADNNDG